MNCNHGRRSWLSSQQRHFANRSVVRKLRHEEINAGRRIFLPDFNHARLDDVHRNAGSPLADNDFRGRELGYLEARSQLEEAFVAEFCEQFDILQELKKLLARFIDYCGHLMVATDERPPGLSLTDRGR